MSDMNFKDCTHLSADEREVLFGKGFAQVVVKGFCVSDGIPFTRIVVDGTPVTLVGDPEKVLHNYLLGRGGRSNEQH